VRRAGDAGAAAAAGLRWAQRAGGKNLSIHPAAAAIGVFADRVDAWNTVPQGYAIDEFKDEGLYFEGASAPLELAALSHTGYGPSWVALMEEFPRSLMFGFMVKDTSRGTVRPRGADDALITYWLNRHDVDQVRRGLGILARVYFAAGAREVHLPVPGSAPLRSVDEVARFERAPLAARQVDLTAYHPLGTCRMGVDPATSVVDASHQVHEVPGLFLCDGSVMPSSLGVNPQLTIMAMALRAAEQIAARVQLHAGAQAA
jgi:choline dehydrogenase-like flavoprotein